MNELPLVIFDGNCGFCKTWVEYWKRLTADRVNYVPSQEVREEFPQLGAQDFARSVLLRMPDGEVLKGARAVFQLLTYAPGRKGWLWLYEHVPGFAPISEAGYRFIAGNREVFDALTRRLLGKPVLPSTYLVVEWLFLRALGVIYFT